MSRKKNPEVRVRVTANLMPTVYAELAAEAVDRNVDPGTVAGERIAAHPRSIAAVPDTS